MRTLFIIIKAIQYYDVGKSKILDMSYHRIIKLYKPSYSGLESWIRAKVTKKLKKLGIKNMSARRRVKYLLDILIK